MTDQIVTSWIQHWLISDQSIELINKQPVMTRIGSKVLKPDNMVEQSDTETDPSVEPEAWYGISRGITLCNLKEATEGSIESHRGITAITRQKL